METLKNFAFLKNLIGFKHDYLFQFTSVKLILYLNCKLFLIYSSVIIRKSYKRRIKHFF